VVCTGSAVLTLLSQITGIHPNGFELWGATSPAYCSCHYGGGILPPLLPRPWQHGLFEGVDRKKVNTMNHMQKNILSINTKHIGKTMQIFEINIRFNRIESIKKKLSESRPRSCR
jgi:hypothetical protein